jgi:uncharacterized membrane protein (Fun14 family)
MEKKELIRKISRYIISGIIGFILGFGLSKLIQLILLFK